MAREPQQLAFIIDRQSLQEMAAVRPTVNVRGVDGAASGSLTLPAVFTAPVRTDVVEAIHSALE